MYFGMRAPRMTRPNNTTAYTNGDLVANNATAGSVQRGHFPAPLAHEHGRAGVGPVASARGLHAHGQRDLRRDP